MCGGCAGNEARGTSARGGWVVLGLHLPRGGADDGAQVVEVCRCEVGGLSQAGHLGRLNLQVLLLPLLQENRVAGRVGEGLARACMPRRGLAGEEEERGGWGGGDAGVCSVLFFWGEEGRVGRETACAAENRRRETTVYLGGGRVVAVGGAIAGGWVNVFGDGWVGVTRGRVFESGGRGQEELRDWVRGCWAGGVEYRIYTLRRCLRACFCCGRRVT